MIGVSIEIKVTKDTNTEVKNQIPKLIFKVSLGSGSSDSIFSRTVDFEARMIL
jgi:hypothetical protein